MLTSWSVWDYFLKCPSLGTCKGACLAHDSGGWRIQKSGTRVLAGALASSQHGRGQRDMTPRL